MTVTRPPETVLMVLERDQQMIPLNTEAFTRGVVSRKQIRTGYIGALLIYRDGSCRRVEEVEITGLFGASLGRKLLSALTSAWHVATKLSEPSRPGLDELKRTITNYVRLDQQRPEPYFSLPEPFDLVERNIRASDSCEDIFKVLAVPPPNEALDVL